MNNRFKERSRFMGCAEWKKYRDLQAFRMLFDCTRLTAGECSLQFQKLGTYNDNLQINKQHKKRTKRNVTTILIFGSAKKIPRAY